jgi:general secretion pathway protein H
MAMLTVGVVSGTQQTPSARLKKSAAMVNAAVKVAYTRATATSKHLRLVFDFEGQTVWLEESESPMLVQSKDLSGAAGADPVTEVERQAIVEGERILKGPPVPKPKFRPVEALGFGDADTGRGGKPLSRGIRFREIQTGHDVEPKTQGRGYLYFWPGGLTERASIQLAIGQSKEANSQLTILISPLTGKVTLRQGAVRLERIGDERDLSEREDPGAF